MPYKIPDEPDVSELEYYLVAIPADPLYRQAIKGHYSDLGSIRFWGLEGREAGSEAAAQSWQRAIAETWRLLEMGWPELIVTYIDDIETLLGILRDQMANQVPCCENIAGSGIPGGGSSTDPVPQPVIDAGYATGTSDYEGYTSYKCMAANLFLDTIIQRLRDFAPIVEAGGIVLSLVLAAFGVMTGLTGIAVAGLLIELGAIIAFVEAIKDFSQQDMLDLADDLDANRESIICAIVEADGIEAAIDAFDAEVNSLFSGVHSAIIRSMNIRHSMQLWLYGEDGPVELASQLAAAGYAVEDYECCQEIYDIEALFTFDSDTQGWELGGADATYPGGHIRIRRTVNDSWARCPMSAINTYGSGTLQAGHTYRFTSVQFSGAYAGTPSTHNVYAAHARTGGTLTIDDNFLLSSMTLYPTWTDDIVDDISGVPDFVIPESGQFYIIQFGVNVGGSTADFRLDNVRIRLLDVT